VRRPSGTHTACAAIAHNLTRTAGTRAAGRHRRAHTTSLRTQLIATPARIAHSAHRQILHLPRDWPYEPGLDEPFRRALHAPGGRQSQMILSSWSGRRASRP
jgi:hypothetical protein